MTEKAAVLDQMYEPRSGELIDGYIQELGQPPATPLTAEEKQKWQELREQLMFGDVEAHAQIDQADAPETLGDVLKGHKYSAQKHEIGIDYFLTEPGQLDLQETWLATSDGVRVEADFSTAQGIREYFSRYAMKFPPDKLKELALTSKKAADKLLAETLVVGGPLHTPDRLVVFEDTTQLVNRLRGLLEYKDFYKRIRSEQADAGDSPQLTEAKRLLVDLHLKVVNASLAEVYPDMFMFLEQTKSFDPITRTIFQQTFERMLPHLIKPNMDYMAKRRGAFFIRLDRVRNGASRSGDRISSVSPELRKYFEQDQKSLEAMAEAPVFSPEEIAILDTIKFDSTKMAETAKALLAHLGLLSEHEGGYSRDRPYRAPDGKWQVVVRNDVDSMTADDPQGGFEIPESFNRTLTKDTAPVGVVAGLGHELEHVEQQENIRNAIGRGIGSDFHGKRSEVLYEAGAIRVERRIQMMLFGRVRSDNAHYMKAMLAIESGANEAEACKVFYDSYRNDNPDESLQSAAKVAVSRVMRLARRMGGINSQPLNYAESGLLLAKTDQLPDHINSLLFDNGAFEIQDLAALHKFDLLPTHNKGFPYNEFMEFMVPLLKKEIAAKKESLENDEANTPTNIL